MTTDIYREQLMEHFKNPQNKGRIKNATTTVVRKNPLCGDTIWMDFVVENGIIKDVKFDGSACAVSIAASSVLTEELIGRRIDDVKKFTKEELLELLGVELTTSRIKCAVLPLEAFQKMAKNYDQENIKKPKQKN